MNADQKRQLVAEIVDVPDAFPRELPPEGRRWFVDRLLRSLESANAGISDVALSDAARDVVAKAKALSAVKDPIKLTGLDVEAQFGSWHRDMKGPRIETIYGAIAWDPTLAEPANESYLDLIIRRRYRAVARMALWVNDSSHFYPLFQYPADGCDVYRINESAVPLWQQATPHIIPGGFQLPRWTIDPAPASMVPAIDELWSISTTECGGNVLECATAMSTVLMDTLLEAKNPNTLLRDINTRSPLHLSICNPTLPDAQPNFVRDPDARRVFDTATTTMSDLQVGDYVYVWNHALYASFNARGDWRGEHAVVSACATRDPMTGFRVTGHGVSPTTIAELHHHLMTDLQTQMELLYRCSVEFLAYMAAAVANPQVTTGQCPITFGATTYTADLYRFQRAISYTSYVAEPATTAEMASFIIVHIPSERRFGLHSSVVSDFTEVTANPNRVVWLAQKPGVANQDDYDPVNWGISYYDDAAGTSKLWPLLSRDNGRLTIRQLEPRDMPDPPLAGSPGTMDVQVVETDTPPDAGRRLLAAPAQWPTASTHVRIEQLVRGLLRPLMTATDSPVHATRLLVQLGYLPPAAAPALGDLGPSIEAFHRWTR